MKGLAVFLLALPMAANADLIYDEAMSGDSDPWYVGGGESLGDVFSGDFVLGTVSGLSPEKWDGYNFTLDGSISQIAIEASDWVESSTGSLNGWQLYSGVGFNAVLAEGFLQQSSGSFSIIFDVAGWMGAFTLGNNTISGGLAYNYQISFVPEPSTLALFGIGLAGMGLARRRKQT